MIGCILCIESKNKSIDLIVSYLNDTEQYLTKINNNKINIIKYQNALNKSQTILNEYSKKTPVLNTSEDNPIKILNEEDIILGYAIENRNSKIEINKLEYNNRILFLNINKTLNNIKMILKNTTKYNLTFNNLSKLVSTIKNKHPYLNMLDYLFDKYNSSVCLNNIKPVYMIIPTVSIEWLTNATYLAIEQYVYENITTFKNNFNNQYLKLCRLWTDIYRMDNNCN